MRKVGLSGFRGGASQVRIGHGSHRRIPNVTSFYCCRRRGRLRRARQSAAFLIDAFVDGAGPCSEGVCARRSKTTGRPGYAPGRSQVRRAANEGETAPIPRNSLLAPSPRVLDADARGSFGDKGFLSRMTAVGRLGGRFRLPKLTRERRYRVLVSAQDRERRVCAISIGRLLLYVDSAGPASAQIATIRQGAANESERPFVDICRQRGRGNALTLLPRP